MLFAVVGVPVEMVPVVDGNAAMAVVGYGQGTMGRMLSAGESGGFKEKVSADRCLAAETACGPEP